MWSDLLSPRIDTVLCATAPGVSEDRGRWLGLGKPAGRLLARSAAAGVVSVLPSCVYWVYTSCDRIRTRLACRLRPLGSPRTSEISGDTSEVPWVQSDEDSGPAGQIVRPLSVRVS